ncbi:MAG: TetR/AcrR family transcriptional regulator [Thermodesulfobacteriota bacterium]|nr:TetR/AcrR family transcriptional regulator [Thermodesulfobacteriota bacterium]
MKKQTSFREIRYKEKREKILRNAAKLFARKGYEKASLEEIASKLKLTKASLYHYITSKEEMLFQIQMQAVKETNSAIEQVLESDMDPVQKLKGAVKGHVSVVTREHVIGALRQQELILPSKWREQVVAERDRFEKSFQKIIREGMDAGLFQALNWKMSTMAALGALNWILRWYSPKGELSADEIGEAMADFIAQGFGVRQEDSEPGRIKSFDPSGPVKESEGVV